MIAAEISTLLSSQSPPSAKRHNLPPSLPLVIPCILKDSEFSGGGNSLLLQFTFFVDFGDMVLSIIPRLDKAESGKEGRGSR